MSVKSKFGILTLVCVVAISVLFWYTQKEPYSTERVVQSVWTKYEVQSIQIGGETDPVIYVDVFDKNDIPKVEKYLEDNLTKEDLTQYEINVFSGY